MKIILCGIVWHDICRLPNSLTIPNLRKPVGLAGTPRTPGLPRLSRLLR